MKNSNWHKQSRVMLLLLRALLFMSFLFGGQQAWALTCKNSDDNSALLSETIGASIAVPQSLPDGSIIWRSETRSMNVVCYKTGANKSVGAENVYVYFNPGSMGLPVGFSLGVNVNGLNVDKSNTKIKLPTVVPVCPQASTTCTETTTKFTISYYVYIAKSGSGTGVYKGSTFDVFQLDGVGGINNVANSNFRYRLTSLNNIRFIGCNATLSINPSSIDFGNIPSNGATVGQLVKASDFSITTSKLCSDPFTLSATYSSTNPVIGNNDALDMGNGLSLKILNKNTSNLIAFNTSQPLADLSSLMAVNVPFSAQLLWNGNQVVKGNFNANMTINLSYN